MVRRSKGIVNQGQLPGARSARVSARYLGASLSRFDQLIQRNRELAHANSCGLPNGIRDRTRCAGDADLAHALDAERVDVLIAFLDLLTLVETGPILRRHFVSVPCR